MVPRLHLSGCLPARSRTCFPRKLTALKRRKAASPIVANLRGSSRDESKRRVEAIRDFHSRRRFQPTFVAGEFSRDVSPRQILAENNESLFWNTFTRAASKKTPWSSSRVFPRNFRLIICLNGFYNFYSPG